MIIVYALTLGPVPVRPPLRTVTVGSIAAVIRVGARTPAPTDAALRRHDVVVRTAAAAARAILPVRFGTIVQDLEELRLLLGARQGALHERLRAVRGRVQMTVRVVDDVRSGRLSASAKAAAGPRRSATREGGEPADRRSGTAYLKSRAAEHEVAGFAPLRDAVRRWVRDERVEKRDGLASVYHLVPRGAAAGYRRALEKAAADAGVRLVVTGPWPPYAFATSF